MYRYRESGLDILRVEHHIHALEILEARYHDIVGTDVLGHRLGKAASDLADLAAPQAVRGFVFRHVKNTHPAQDATAATRHRDQCRRAAAASALPREFDAERRENVRRRADGGAGYFLARIVDQRAIRQYPDGPSHIDHAAVCLSGAAPARGEIRIRARSPGYAAPSLGRHMNPMSSAMPRLRTAVTTVRHAAFASCP